jgi:hypothetical protein
MNSLWSVFLLSLSLLAGCSQEALVAKFTPDKENKIARAYIDQLQRQEFENIEAHLDPSLKTSNIRAILEKMSSLFPKEAAKSVKTVGANTVFSNSGKDVNLTYEFEYPDKWLLVNVATRDKGGAAEIVGFNVQPQSDSLENIHKFSLVGKSPVHYLFLALAIAAAIFSFVTLVVCVRLPKFNKKWLWIIGILFGVGGIGLNWTTGEVFFNVIYFQLFSASANAIPFGPWTLTVSIPVFSIIFWIKRNDLIRHDDSAPSASRTPMAMQPKAD